MKGGACKPLSVSKRRKKVKKEKSSFYLILSYLILSFLLVTPIMVYAGISPGRKTRANQALSEWIKFNHQFDNKCRIRWDPHTGLPGQMIGHLTKPFQGNPEDISLNFITQNRGLFQIDPANIKLGKITKAGKLRSIKYRQCYKDLPVMGRRVIVVVDDEGQVMAYNSNFDPFIELQSVHPRISHGRAEERAKNAVSSRFFSSKKLTLNSKKQLSIYQQEGEYYLCWPIGVSSPDVGSWFCLINASTGDLLDMKDTIWPSHGHISGLIFPEYSYDKHTWMPLGGEGVNFEENITAVTDPFWGGYGTSQAGSFTTTLSGPYVSVGNNVTYPRSAVFASPEVAEYDWIEIDNPTGIIESQSDFHLREEVNLDFSFSFFGTLYNQLFIDSCGFLCFSDTQYYFVPDGIPNPYPPNGGIIAPFWRAFDISQGGRILYLSTSDYFVVTWEGIAGYYSGCGPQTFQVILKPNGKIIFQY